MDKSVLQEAEQLINGERKSQYGHVSASYKRIAQMWGAIIGCSVTPKQALMCMASLKMIREDYAHKRDNLVDAAGYIGLVEHLNEPKPV